MGDDGNKPPESTAKKTPTKLEVFAQFCQVAQTLLVTISIIYGGWWTWRNFIYQQKKDREASESEKIKLEQQKLEIAREKKKDVAIIVDLEITHIKSSKNADNFLLVTAKLKNNGNSTTNLSLTDTLAPLQISKLEITKKGQAQSIASERHWAPGQASSIKTTLRPGMTKSLPFLVKIREPGFYLVTFQTEASKENDDGLPPLKPDQAAVWTQSQIVLVE